MLAVVRRLFKSSEEETKERSSELKSCLFVVRNGGLGSGLVPLDVAGNGRVFADGVG